jgi:putative spermidine/putrescine transport system substrate-binding protein
MLALGVAACGSSSSGGSTGSGPTGLTVPTANLPIQSTIGKGEGHLNLIAWEGYTQPQWVKPFEQQTGCKVHATYAGSSNQMVTQMANGGNGQVDMVSASGDADLRMIYAGDVRPINPDLVPQIKNFHSFLQAPSFNTIDGKHYGASLQFGPNVLLYNTDSFSSAPTSWSVLYDPKYSGKITVPDNPIQIADAALYLSKRQPDLGISDPYELTQSQFDAAVNLLKKQQPLVKKYWGLASQEISLFKTNTVSVGAAWPYQTSSLLATHAPIADTIPGEGATGWADSWLLAAKAPHPNCAYMWMDYITTPKVQAQQATYYGETPANKLACPIMDKLVKGSCAAYHANATEAYYNTIKFWKTPLAQCGDGQNNCVPYSKWQTAWTEIVG